MTRRVAIGALGVGGLAYMINPIGTRKRDPRSKGRTVIRYWEKWTGHEGAAMGRVVDRYNSMQSKVWVDLLAVSQIDVKGLLAIAGGDPPDVMGVWSFSLPAFVEHEAFMPFDSFNGGGEIDRERYVPAVWECVSIDDRQWAGINTVGSIALYYNKKMFREVGLDPERPPRTIEELDEYTERLTVRNPDGSLARAGFLPKEPGWFPGLWPYLFGGALFDDSSQTVTADLPENAAAFEWIKSFPRRFGSDSVQTFSSGFGNYNSPQNAFLDGDVAMVQQGPWLVNNIKMFTPDLEYGACAMPPVERIYDPDRPVSLVESDALVIPRGCKHPEEAWEFVQFTQRRDVQEELSTVHCKPSPYREVSAGFIENHPNLCVQEHARLLASDRAVVWPRVSVWPFYADEVRKAVDKVWERESLSGAEAVAELQRRVSGEHERLMARIDQQRAARGGDS